MFEQEYKRANDRIHPRKDLLKEMEANWASEEARRAAEAEEEAKVVAFPGWAKYVSMAAGILLCVGLGMGSVLLFSRGRNKTASAQAPQMAESRVAEEEAKIVSVDMAMEQDAVRTETTMEAEAAAPMLMASGFEAPQGMHPAADETEVEDALVYYGYTDGGEANAEIPEAQMKSASVNTASYPAGQILSRDDLMVVFLPTADQVRVIRYADRRATSVFSLGLREKGAQVEQLFWTDGEMLAVREKNKDTELMRFDVSDWAKPRHLVNLSQSGAFLGAAELGGQVLVLSLYGATDQEPLPWVNGTRMDFADVLLDSDRPGDVFTVITAYDPDQSDGFRDQKALLAECAGVAFGHEKLLLWTCGEEPALYVFSCSEEGELTLLSEGTRQGTILSAGALGEGFSLLLQRGNDVELVTVEADLTETGSTVAVGAGQVKWARIDEEGAVFLTEDDIHWLTIAGDRSLAATGDAFSWLTAEQGLLFSADGKLQLLSLDGDGIRALGAADTRNSLALLVEDPSRLGYDPATGRLALPAGQMVYQYRINENGELALWGSPLTFYDHNETDQRELRCRMTAEGLLVFYKSGVIVCNQTLEKLITLRY